MTIVYKHIEFIANSGLHLFIEEYSEKPFLCVKFWRYGCNDIIWSDMLMSRPSKRKLIESY